MATQYTNIGNVHMARGEINQAVYMYEKSLWIDKELGRKEGMAITFANLGIAREACGDFDNARHLWDRSLRLFEEISSPNAEEVRERLADLET